MREQSLVRMSLFNCCSTTGSKLLSVSILHRHGARGPGKSELKPFSASSPVSTQWNEEELEKLTTLGHDQISTLGEYFANKYIIGGLIEVKDSNETFWRSSKAERARESGDEFTRSVNATCRRRVFFYTEFN